MNPKDTVTIEDAALNAPNTLNYFDDLLAIKESDDSAFVTCTAQSTLIEVPGGYKSIEEFRIGDEVLVADMSLNWATAQISISDGTSGHNNMVYIKFGNAQSLTVTYDQLFMRSDRKLIRASNIIAEKDCLMDRDGNPVKVRDVAFGPFNGSINNISTDVEFNGSPDGHLLLAEGVVIGDYLLQIMSVDEQYMAE